MKKILPYLPAALMAILWYALQRYQWPQYFSFNLGYGLAGVAALLFAAAAWRRRHNPEEAYYQVVLFGLAALLSPVIGELLTRGDLDIDYYADAMYATFLPLLRLALPFVLVRWKDLLQGKINNSLTQTGIYFLGAFFLSLGAAGFRPYYGPEWMLVGILLTLFIYWQNPIASAPAGILGSLLLLTVNVGYLYEQNERLREICYDLGGPAWKMEEQSRVDWLGYRCQMVWTFLTDPFLLITTIAMVAMAIITAAIIIRLAEDRKMAVAFAGSIVLEVAIFAVEQVLMLYDLVGIPFIGRYLGAYVLMAWLIKPSKDRKAE